MSNFFPYYQSLNYNDPIQLDGAFMVAHVNYHKSPEFNGISSENLAYNSRKGKFSTENQIENVISHLQSFDGTEKNYKKDDRKTLWKSYWFEYINAFGLLADNLPHSVVTAYVGRQGIEVGFKYLILCKSNQIIKQHDIGKLSREFCVQYAVSEDYLKYVDKFCELYCTYIEGGNPEYFRFPEYKCNSFFAGNHLDISWLSYNFTLILLKLIHFAGFDDEIVHHNNK